MVVFDRRPRSIYSTVAMTSSAPSPRTQAEFDAIRAAISQRSTARVILLPIVFAAWGALTVAATAAIAVALGTLIPLLVLAAGFEAVFALHVNVERLGRYLQVFHERDANEWEHVTAAFGNQFAGTPDPLFTRLFILATSVNFFPVALGGERWEVALIGICHFALVYRVRKAQTFAAAQRSKDLKAFETIRTTLTRPTTVLEERESEAARPTE